MWRVQRFVMLSVSLQKEIKRENLFFLNNGDSILFLSGDSSTCGNSTLIIAAVVGVVAFVCIAVLVGIFLAYLYRNKLAKKIGPGSGGGRASSGSRSQQRADTADAHAIAMTIDPALANASYSFESKYVKNTV